MVGNGCYAPLDSRGAATGTVAVTRKWSEHVAALTGSWAV